ncbi:hypothetical protein FHG87_022965 [Trinorchestia longiramus]|nr:hypothetical protein FHG87_022965 [Trinorchestia longiramus]
MSREESPQLSPSSLSSPQLSPSSLSSPQLSPSSSPTSSPHINASPATRNLIVGVTSSSPHFITEKRPKYTFTTSANKSNINSTTRCNNINSSKPLTVLTTTSTSSRVPLNASRITPTIISRSQPINKVSDNTNCSKSNARVIQKSSPSPSVVTLSGVNKTAGIIKSPSVISVSRKHTVGAVHNGTGITSNGSGTVINSSAVIGTIEQQQQAPKPIAVISPSGEVVASSGSQVFKTVTVSSTNGRFTTANGQQVIFAPRGIVSSLPAGRIVRSGQNILVPFDPKSMEKLRTIKIVSSKSGSLTATPGVRTLSTMGAGTTTATILRSTSSASTPSSTPSHSFVTSRARTIGITGVSPTSRPATVSILKNVCVPLETKAPESSYGSLVSHPKQEGLDSDEEMEFPKKNEPLVLTGE